MGAQDINSYQPLPEQTWYSSIPGMRVFVDKYNSGRNYKSTTGKRLLCLADPKDASFNLKPDFDPVEAGAVNVVLENIVKGWNGNLKLGAQDLNPMAMEVGNGTTTALVDVEPTVPVTGDIAASGSDKTKIKMATGDAANFSAHIGEAILISSAAGTEKMRGFIKEVDTTNEWIYLFYELDEIPLASGTVTLLEGFELDLGGNQAKVREFILANDFGVGAKHRQVIWRGQPVGGFDQSPSNAGKTKTTVDIMVLGYSKTSGGKLQVVPSSIYGTYGKVAA